jgi:hypothetical protein
MEATVPLPNTTTGRAARPGSSSIRGWAVAAVFVVLLAALGFGVYGLTAAHGRTIGYVAPQRHPVDQTVVGTLAHPALTIEGDYVKAHTSTFSALAVVNGPVVPGEGLPFQATFTTCTWTISLSHVTGRVPISVADFDSIDHRGVVFNPYLVPGQPKLPSILLPGHSLTFKIRAVMPVGEGLMRWAPDGDHIVAKWDYQVEND